MAKTDKRPADYKRISKQILEARALYYNTGESKLSDAEFDALVLRQQALADELGIEIKSEIGAAIMNKAEGKKHWSPMLSLKTFTYDQVEQVSAWYEAIMAQCPKAHIVMEPKWDGIAISLTYKNSRITRALTRGDGELGQDVFLNALNILSIPHVLNDDVEFMEIRGEVIIEKIHWDKQSKITGRLRNLANGALMGKQSKEVLSRYLRFIPYEVVTYVKGKSAAHDAPKNHMEAMLLALRLGFHIPPEGLPKLLRWERGFNEIADSQNALESRSKAFITEIDGAVFKVNDNADRQALGLSRTSPKWACAWKFPPEMQVATISAIDWQVSPQGTVTPVAVFKHSVNIGGSKISQVSLHNGDFVVLNDIRLGDDVHVSMAGDVIPQFTAVTQLAKLRDGRAGAYMLPRNCPVCQAKLVKSGKKLKCTGGMTCYAQAIQAFQKWAHKDAMKMPVLNRLVIGTLMDLPGVKDPADLYQINFTDLQELGIFSSKRCEEIAMAIEASKELYLQNVLLGLNIPRMDKAYAKRLDNQYKSLSGLLEGMRLGTAIENNAVNKALRGFLESDYGQQLVSKLIAVGF